MCERKLPAKRVCNCGFDGSRAAGEWQEERAAGREAGEVGSGMGRVDGNGRHPNIDPPTEWRRDKNILWQTPVEGGGYSSPIVVGGKVFVTAEMGSLLCLRLAERARRRETWRCRSILTGER